VRGHYIPHKNNEAFRERKEAVVNDVGQVVTMCIDNKAHSFKQIKLSRYSESMIFTASKLKRKRFIDGTFYYELEKDETAYYSRVFCSKCSISTVVLVMRRGETPSGN
jgi:hypothetical protein